MANVKLQGFLAGLVLSLLLSGVFLGLNFRPQSTIHIDLDSRTQVDHYTRVAYGWPGAFRSSTTYLENPENIFGGGGTLISPRFAPPKWVTKEEFDFKGLMWNFYWCGLMTLFAGSFFALMWASWLSKFRWFT